MATGFSEKTKYLCLCRSFVSSKVAISSSLISMPDWRARGREGAEQGRGGSWPEDRAGAREELTKPAAPLSVGEIAAARGGE